MREILFRGKRKDNGEWVEGHLLADDVIIPKGQEFGVEANYIVECDLKAYVVDPETVGQDTGLTDKNGKKIFGGGTYLKVDMMKNTRKMRVMSVYYGATMVGTYNRMDFLNLTF